MTDALPEAAVLPPASSYLNPHKFGRLFLKLSRLAHQKRWTRDGRGRFMVKTTAGHHGHRGGRASGGKGKR